MARNGGDGGRGAVRKRGVGCAIEFRNFFVYTREQQLLLRITVFGDVDGSPPTGASSPSLTFPPRPHRVHFLQTASNRAPTSAKIDVATRIVGQIVQPNPQISIIGKGRLVRVDAVRRRHERLWCTRANFIQWAITLATPQIWLYVAIRTITVGC